MYNVKCHIECTTVLNKYCQCHLHCQCTHAGFFRYWRSVRALEEPTNTDGMWICGAPEIMQGLCQHEKHMEYEIDRRGAWGNFGRKSSNVNMMLIWETHWTTGMMQHWSNWRTRLLPAYWCNVLIKWPSDEMSHDKYWPIVNNCKYWPIVNNCKYWPIVNNCKYWPIVNNCKYWPIVNNCKYWPIVNNCTCRYWPIIYKVHVIYG